MLELHAEAKLKLGSTHAEKGDIASAKPNLEQALTEYQKLASDDKEASLWLTQQAEALILLDRYPEAIKALDEAIRRIPNPGHFQKKAIIHLHLGDPAGYKADCKAALDKFPAGGRVSAIWCCVLNSSSDLDLKALLPTLEKNPDSYQQRNTLGALLYRLGGSENTRRSIEVLNDSVRLFERSPVRQRRDAYDADASLPEGRPVDWIFLAMAHFRRAADPTVSESGHKRHRDQAQTCRAAVDQLLKNGPLGEFGTGAIPWNRLELKVLMAECDRDYPR
jgi:tetratricopeptide (TPR) repeat protein